MESRVYMPPLHCRTLNSLWSLAHKKKLPKKTAHVENRIKTQVGAPVESITYASIVQGIFNLSLNFFIHELIVIMFM